MAKKAKRRGRPPGSKNRKPSARGLPARLKTMNVGQLRAHIGDLENLLTAKITQQRQVLEGQLAELQGYVSAKAAGVVRAVMRVPRTGKRAKPKPKYQSRNKPSLKWTGRGLLPRWMREEMKGTKLTKDDFLITKRA